MNNALIFYSNKARVSSLLVKEKYYNLLYNQLEQNNIKNLLDFFFLIG